MAFWVLCAVLAALSIAFVVWPLLRNTAQQSDRQEAEVAIYQDQLREIERDLERNLIKAEEAKAAKLEVSRRLLAADDIANSQSDQAQRHTAPNKIHERLAMIVAIGITTFAMGSYLMLGSPGLPGLPHAERAKADPAKVPITELIARVEARLRENPNDARGWDVLAPAYLRQEAYVKAVGAFQRAIQLNGENERRLAQYAEAILGVSNGDVSEAVVAVYKRLLKLRPDYLVAHFWLTVRHEQQNRPEQAITGYRKLLERQDLPSDMRQLMTNRITALGGKAPSEAPAPDGKGFAPSQEARKEMARLSPEERQQRIRAMVDGLASRLREDGGERSEWQRLIRAFRVLGQNKEAQQAYRDALKAFKDNPQESEALKTFAEQLGIVSKDIEN